MADDKAVSALDAIESVNPAKVTDNIPPAAAAAPVENPMVTNPLANGGAAHPGPDTIAATAQTSSAAIVTPAAPIVGTSAAALAAVASNYSNNAANVRANQPDFELPASAIEPETPLAVSKLNARVPTRTLAEVPEGHLKNEELRAMEKHLGLKSGVLQWGTEAGEVILPISKKNGERVSEQEPKAVAGLIATLRDSGIANARAEHYSKEPFNELNPQPAEKQGYPYIISFKAADAKTVSNNIGEKIESFVKNNDIQLSNPVGKQHPSYRFEPTIEAGRFERKLQVRLAADGKTVDQDLSYARATETARGLDNLLASDKNSTFRHGSALTSLGGTRHDSAATAVMQPNGSYRVTFDNLDKWKAADASLYLQGTTDINSAPTILTNALVNQAQENITDLGSAKYTKSLESINKGFGVSLKPASGEFMATFGTPAEAASFQQHMIAVAGKDTRHYFDPNATLHTSKLDVAPLVRTEGNNVFVKPAFLTNLVKADGKPKTFTSMDDEAVFDSFKTARNNIKKGIVTPEKDQKALDAAKLASEEKKYKEEVERKAKEVLALGAGVATTPEKTEAKSPAPAEEQKADATAPANVTQADEKKSASAQNDDEEKKKKDGAATPPAAPGIMDFLGNNMLTIGMAVGGLLLGGMAGFDFLVMGALAVVGIVASGFLAPESYVGSAIKGFMNPGAPSGTTPERAEGLAKAKALDTNQNNVLEANEVAKGNLSPEEKKKIFDALLSDPKNKDAKKDASGNYVVGGLTAPQQPAGTSAPEPKGLFIG